MKSTDNILLKIKKDRRLLSNVPDPTGERQFADRRGRSSDSLDLDEIMRERKKGVRYVADLMVSVLLKERTKLTARCVDISATGMLLEFEEGAAYEKVKAEKSVRLSFSVPPGVMPEGQEGKYRLTGSVVRHDDGTGRIGIQFAEDLETYEHRRRDRFLMVSCSLCLFFVSFCVVLMRAESVVYFRYNALLYSYSIIAATFLLSRYLFGMLYRPVPIDPSFTPSVTVIIPCFNEEEWIQTTVPLLCRPELPGGQAEGVRGG